MQITRNKSNFVPSLAKVLDYNGSSIFLNEIVIISLENALVYFSIELKHSFTSLCILYINIENSIPSSAPLTSTAMIKQKKILFLTHSF